MPLVDVCKEVIIRCCKPGQCMLVFLPGLGNILELHEALTRSMPADARIRVFALHSLMPRQEQEEAFQNPPPTHGHVVLATNIAESSLTLPEVSVVVDFGLHKEIVYDTNARRCCLVHSWCSWASAAQRAGRTGRVRPGTVVRLYSRDFYEQCLSEFESAEITRLPLDKLFLQVRQLGDALAGPREILPPSVLLQEAIQPPSTAQLDAAVDLLAQVGALSHPSEMAEITFLGRIGLRLPVDLSLVRLLLFSVVLGCPVDGVIMAASLATPLDVFSLPSHLVMGVTSSYANSLWRSLCTRWKFDMHDYSEPLMWRNLFREWMSVRSRALHKSRDCGARFDRVHVARAFCTEHAVSWQRLLTLESSVRDIANRLIEAFPSATEQHLHHLLTVLAPQYTDDLDQEGGRPQDEQCWNTLVLKSALTAAFAFNILESTPGELTETVGKTGKRQRKVATEALASQCNPQLTIYVTNIPRHLRSDDGAKLVAALPDACRDNVQVVMTGDHAFIQCAADSDNEDGDQAVFCDLPKRGHLLCQLGGGRHRCFLPNVSQSYARFPPPSDPDDPTGSTAIDGCVTINSRSQPFQLQWRLVTGEGAAQVQCSWRNPIGHARETRGMDGGLKPCFAVAATIQGVERAGFVNASGVTALPTLCGGRLAQLMLLVFLPHTMSVEMHQQQTTGRVQAARAGQLNLEFDPPLSCDMVRALLDLRCSLSQSMDRLQSKMTHGREDVQRQVLSFYEMVGSEVDGGGFRDA